MGKGQRDATSGYDRRPWAHSTSCASSWKGGADVNLPHPKAGAGLNALNKTGATPFSWRHARRILALLKLLHALGADPSILTVDEVTPLIAAAGLGTLAAGVAGTWIPKCWRHSTG